MKRFDICNFLMGKISPDEFSEIHQGELHLHLSMLKKRGGSAPIFVTGEEYIFVNEHNLSRVLNYFSAGEISKELLAYLLDALSLDEKAKFSENKIREIVLDLADTDLDRIDIDTLFK